MGFYLISFVIVEVINNFPVQDLVVLLREKRQEAKLGVIHPATEHPQPAQHWFLVSEN